MDYSVVACTDSIIIVDWEIEPFATALKFIGKHDVNIALELIADCKELNNYDGLSYI